MTAIEEATKPLVEAVTAHEGLPAAYDAYVQTLSNSYLWSEANPSGLLIPWKQATIASKHSSLSDAFRSKGLYLFGGKERIPKYIGMTGATLWNRLRGRYVCGKRCQCQLAVDYTNDLVQSGIDGFPDEVRVWYRKNYGSSTARLEGAVEFARSGPGDIWFTLIPTPQFDSKEVLQFEGMMIRTASKWNMAHGYPPLLNTQGLSG